MPAADRRAPGRAASRSSSGSASWRDARAPGRAQPAAHPRARVRRRRAAARRRRDLRLVRPLLLRAVPPAAHDAGSGSTRTSHVDGHRAHRGRRRRRATAWCSRCRTSATGTSPARGSRARATRSRWSPSRSSRPSCSSGSSRPASRSACASIPLVADGRRRGAAARCAPTRSCACSCDRDLTGDGVEVEFFGERTTLPGGPGDARAAQRRAAAPGRLLLPARRRVTRSDILRPDRHRADGPPPRRRRPGHPGARPPLRGADPGRSPSSGTCCSPTGPATADRPCWVRRPGRLR